MTKDSIDKRRNGKPKRVSKGIEELRKSLELATGKELRKKEFRKAGAIGNVFLLLDCSGSMDSYNKMPNAINGAIGFVVEALESQYAVGIIRFDSTAYIVSEPLEEKSILVSKIRSIGSTGGSTNMTDAIDKAHQALLQKEGLKVICLVTDGWPDNPTSAISAADRAKKAEIEIMTIGTEDADYDLLKRIASQAELSKQVKSEEIGTGIKSMAKMLPGRKTPDK